MTQSSDDRNVHWGIMGTADISAKVCRAIRLAKGAEVRAIASREIDRAQVWAGEHGVEMAYGSYQSLLDDDEIDAVYIPLPPSLHREWAIKAARRGKHILCEKPLATNFSEAREVASACSKAGVQMMDGVMWVHHDRTALMQSQMEQGMIGELRRVNSAFSFFWEDMPKQNIRMSRDLGGGCLSDLGYYCVRVSLWAFGEMPVRAFAGASFANGVEVSLTGLLWFEGGWTAGFDCGYQSVFRNWFEIAGTEATMTCSDFVLPSTEKTVAHSTCDKNSHIRGHITENCIQEVRMIENFSKAVASGQIVNDWPRDALNTVAVCDALRSSAERGEVVEIDSGGLGP